MMADDELKCTGCGEPKSKHQSINGQLCCTNFIPGVDTLRFGSFPPDWIEEIEARANAATPGPWHAWLAAAKDDCEGITAEHPRSGNPKSVIMTSPEVRPASTPDGQFIAHAREDIPKLIAEVRRLKAALRLAEFGSCDGCGIEGKYCSVCSLNQDAADPYEHRPGCPVGEALK